MHLTFDSVNDAFRRLVRGIHTGEIPTVQRPSRNGDVLQIDEPVTITYRKPTRRVLFNPVRDANPFFHVYEALWMLAGRNDVAPLTYYNSRMREFSDDGETLNGAYGYRWREANQLDIIVDHLKVDPTSRRAVLQMWNVEDDLLKLGHYEPCKERGCVNGKWQNARGLAMLAEGADCPICRGAGKRLKDFSKDVCCLAPEVKFRSPEGDTDIASLAGRFQSESGFKFPVYSIDTVTGDQQICWMTNAWKTGVKPVFKVSFDDGSSVRMTADHKVFRKTKMFDGKRCIGIKVDEVTVGDLSVGDRLLATLSEDSAARTNVGGYRQYKRNVFRNTGGRNMALEHREYVRLFQPLLDGHLVHHENGNKLDNRLSNLTQMVNRDHYRMGKTGQDNPHCRMSADDKVARGRKHSASIRAYWDGVPADVRSAMMTHKKNRTPEQEQLIADFRGSRSNHKVVGIERAGVTPVYDFTVPGRHNAVLSNGVVVHNCNLSVMFSLRNVESEPTILPDHANPGRHNTMTTIRRHLDMTVTNRSNDLIWGLLGANVVHFSFLQEYLAARLGVEVGRYNQFTNNLHVYTERWKPEEWLAYRESGYDGWESFDSLTHRFSTYPEGVEPFPLVKDPIAFDRELPLFVKRFSGKLPPEELAAQWSEPFFNDVAQPMLIAFSCAKEGDYHSALLGMEEIAAQDWRVVATQWLERRANRRKENTVDNLED